MEFKATVHHGSLTIEIMGEDREEIQQEMLELASFVEENEAQIGSFRQIRGSEGTTNDGASKPQEGVSGIATQRGGGGDFSSIADRTRVDEATLTQLFEVPEDEDEVPFLTLFRFDEDVGLLGNHRNQQQARGSVLLLYLWKECRGVESVELGQLDEALSYSEISSERRDAMYGAFGGDAGNWLNSDGNAIELTPRGEQEARELIRGLAEDVSS